MQVQKHNIYIQNNKTKDKNLEKSPLTTFEPINLGAMFEETILASDENFLANCKTNYTGFLVRL